MIAEIRAVNLLLYLRYDSFTNRICENNYIFCFNNEKIIAVDEFRYDREERYNLQKKFSIRPYYISQRIFHELLKEACSSESNISLKQITFIDESVILDSEYENLMELIHKGYYEGMYSTIINILEEFDTEIKNIKINYNGYDFKLTDKGVIETFAPRSVIMSIINDNRFNRIILGIG